jgi:hypothetical protein
MAAGVRRDIQTGVAFLTTRVKSPDKDDWGKLKRVLKYLNGTKYLKLSISVANLGILKWYFNRITYTGTAKDMEVQCLPWGREMCQATEYR